MALPKAEARITFSSVQSFSLDEGGGALACTIAAGSYSLVTLVTALTTALDAAGALTYTATLDDGSDTATGSLVLDTTAAATITWGTGTAVRDALGLSGATTEFVGAGSSTDPSYPPTLWLPNCDRAPLTPNSTTLGQHWGRLERTYTRVRSPSGVGRALVSSERYSDVFQFDTLRGNKVWKVLESVTNESFQTWLETLGSAAFYWYPDRSDDTKYWLLAFRDLTVLPADPVVAGWVGTNSLWRLGPLVVDEWVDPAGV